MADSVSFTVFLEGVWNDYGGIIIAVAVALIFLGLGAYSLKRR